MYCYVHICFQAGFPTSGKQFSTGCSSAVCAHTWQQDWQDFSRAGPQLILFETFVYASAWKLRWIHEVYIVKFVVVQERLKSVNTVPSQTLLICIYCCNACSEDCSNQPTKLCSSHRPSSANLGKLRLVKNITTHLSKMQEVYDKLSNSLSEATVAPESLDQCLGWKGCQCIANRIEAYALYTCSYIN